MRERFATCAMMLMAGAWLLHGCTRPDLPTNPPLHLALTATVEINKKAYPVNFTWEELNYVAWDEGRGWHTDWKSSDRTCVKFLDDKYAVIVWLPEVGNTHLNQFVPTFALIERDKLEFLRWYPELRVGEKRDGVFELTQLKIERSPISFPPQTMTNDEKLFKADLAGRKYGYLFGMMFTQDEWGQSPELKRLLGGMRGMTSLGKRAPQRKEMSDVWSAFSTFNAGQAIPGKMDTHPFGCEFKGGVWTPLTYPGVYWYREEMANEAGPIWMSLQGQRVDQQQSELFFDAGQQQLFVVWRYPLEPLEYGNQ